MKYKTQQLILILITFISVATLLVMSFFSEQRSTKQKIIQYEEGLLSDNYQITSKIELQFEHLFKDLYLLSQTRSVQFIEKNECLLDLIKVYNLNSEYLNGIYRYDKDMKLKYSYPSKNIPFKEIKLISSFEKMKMTGKPVWKIIKSEETKVSYMILARPVYTVKGEVHLNPSNKFSGIVLFITKLSEFQKLFYLYQYINPDVKLWILNADDLILAYPIAKLTGFTFKELKEKGLVDYDNEFLNLLRSIKTGERVGKLILHYSDDENGQKENLATFVRENIYGHEIIISTQIHKDLVIKEIEKSYNMGRLIIIGITFLVFATSFLSVIFLRKGFNEKMNVLLREKKEKEEHEIERKEMQAQIIQSAKMASIGELAAGVAHEINNPLAIICGNIDMNISELRKESINSEKMLLALAKQSEAAKRITNIVQGLSSYARLGGDDLVPVDLHRVINETVSLLEVIYEKENIKLEIKLYAKNFKILASVVKIQQILMNLLGNAKDAIGDKDGVIEIETSNVEDDLIIKVTDNGTGIKKEDLEKIYDTFFTTKEIGKGTGLGLSLTQSMVNQFDGTLMVQSKYGEGTTFSMIFPIVTSDEIKKEVPEEEISLTPLSGKILVVDDEDDIRIILDTYLKSFGLEVELAANVKEACELIKNNNFDLILTDMQMPGESGLDLIKMIRNMDKKKNNIKIVLVTGAIGKKQSDEDIDFLNENVAQILNKPFTEENIYEIVKKYI